MKEGYDGPDRRVHNCKYEDKIGEISDAVIRTEGAVEKLDLRINGTLEKMGKHIDDSDWWRKFIAGTAVSLVVAILGFAATSWAISYNLGQYANQIITVTKKTDELSTDLKTHLFRLDELHRQEMKGISSGTKS